MQNKIIVSCASCGSKFYVASSEIYSAGRFVRCTVCEHEWLVKPSDFSPVATNIEDHTEQSLNLLKSNKHYIYSGALLIVAFFFLMFVYLSDYLMLSDEGASISEAGQITKNLAIKEVSFQIGKVYDKHLESVGRNKNLLVTVTVANFADTESALENIEVIALDAAKKVIGLVNASPHAIVQPQGIFSVTVKLVTDSLVIPEYTRIIVNGKKSKNRDIFNQLDRLVRVQY